jgi:integrase
VWQAVQRLLRWGEKTGRTGHSLVCDYQKPGATRRTVVISPDTYRTVILPNIRSAAFRDLVVVAWEVGARPQEFLKAEARHYDAAAKRLVLPPEEAKVDKWPRVIYLTDAAAHIVGRLVAEHPTGKLFRNASGGAWTNSSVNCEWVRLRHRLGFARMTADGVEPTEDAVAAQLRTLNPRRRDGREKTPRELREEARLKVRQKMASRLAPKFCLYHFRHSWLDRMLKAGTDALTCAILMGHRDPSMVAKTYQHLAQSGDYLRAALNRAAG